MRREPSPERRLRLAVVGLGRVGSACVGAAAGVAEVTVKALVRRRGSLGLPLPEGMPRGVAVCEAGTLRGVDAALVCVPADHVVETARQLLSRGVAVVEAARVPHHAARAHTDAIHREALRHRCAAVIGAGWDPGALSLLRGWLALLVPRGHTHARVHPAATLHHSLAGHDIAGVRDALTTELRGADGRMQRYVYAELLPGADPEQASRALRSDPLFLDEETVVVPVESVAALEEEGEGVVLERWGTAGGGAHQRFLFEARFDPAVATAQLMLAAARALPTLPPGAHSLLDVPAAQLFGPYSTAAREAHA